VSRNIFKMREVFLVFMMLFSHLSALTNDEYISWWNSNRNSLNLPEDLRKMEDYFVNNGLISYSSNFWNYFNKINIEQISNHGFDNFKQTVAGNYFTWKVDINHPYAHNLKRLVPIINKTIPISELNRKHLLWSQNESMNFNIITMYYLNYMLNLGWEKYINELEEPLVGNPPFVLFNGKRVSQDIFNSLLEYLSVIYHCPMDEINSIVEIGAGYGRTAYCFLTFHPEKKYIIADIPPALYVSQEYLTRVFPERKAMKFRVFDNFNDIKQEFLESDIVFLTPDQLSKIPDGSINLFLAIDCLHEMKKERVEHYFDEANRLSNFFYYKCWTNTHVVPDDVHHLENTYPIKIHWKEIFKQPCEIPSGFFHAMYKLN
jgi:putative sugar O-methyltransferase